MSVIASVVSMMFRAGAGQLASSTRPPRHHVDLPRSATRAFQRRWVAIQGNGVSSDRPSVSSFRSAPCPQLTSLQDTRNRVTPCVRRSPMDGGGAGGGRLARASFILDLGHGLLSIRATRSRPRASSHRGRESRSAIRRCRHRRAAPACGQGKEPSSTGEPSAAENRWGVLSPSRRSTRRNPRLG